MAVEQGWTAGSVASSCKFSALDAHERWPHPNRLQSVSFYLYHVSVFRICMPANDKGPLLFLLNTLQPVLYVCAFVCATLHFGSLSQAGVAHKLAWHCGPHGALSAIRSLCCRFIDTMQRGGINGDNYSSIEWGLLGALDYQHFYEAFSFPLWRIVLLWPLAPSSSSHHTVENQWLHYVGCFGQRPVRRSRAIMYYSCGTIKI